MEFSIETCAMLIMKCEKRPLVEGTELPNQDSIRTVEEEKNYI